MGEAEGEKAPWGPIDGWGAVQTGACILRRAGAGGGQRQKTPPRYCNCIENSKNHVQNPFKLTNIFLAYWGAHLTTKVCFRIKLLEFDISLLRFRYV